LTVPPPPPPEEMDRLLLLERLIWQRVNEKRHRAYTRNWKEFYRRWRGEDDWQWPTHEGFCLQHRRLVDAARQHGLEFNPLPVTAREELIKVAVQEVSKLVAAGKNEVAQVLPSVDQLLP